MEQEQKAEKFVDEDLLKKATEGKAESTKQRRAQIDASYEQLFRYGLTIESESEARLWGELLAKETRDRARPIGVYIDAAIGLAKSADNIRKRLYRVGGKANPKGSVLEAARWQTLRSLDQIDTFFRGANQFPFDPPSPSRGDKQKIRLSFLVTYTQMFESMKSSEVALDFDLPSNRRGRWLREQANHVIEIKKIPIFRLFLGLAREQNEAEPPIIGSWFDNLYSSIRFAYLTEESLIILNDIARACRRNYPIPPYKNNPDAYPWAEVIRALYVMHCEIREARKKLLSPKSQEDL